MSTVAGINGSQTPLIDNLALKHLLDTSGGDISDVGHILAASILAGHPAGLEPALVLGHLVPVSCEVGRDAVVEISDIVLPSESHLEALVHDFAEILVRS